jgi:hypothetical protein
VNTASASISREWHRYFCRTAMLHLAILLVYTIAFTLTLNHLSNKFRNGPDLIHCRFLGLQIPLHSLM